MADFGRVSVVMTECICTLTKLKKLSLGKLSRSLEQASLGDREVTMLARRLPQLKELNICTTDDYRRLQWSRIYGF
mgnify:CR=1 FL=1